MRAITQIIATLFIFSSLVGCHHKHNHEHEGHNHSTEEHEEHEHDEHEHGLEAEHEGHIEGHDHSEDLHNKEEEGIKKHEGEVHLNQADMHSIETETVGFNDFSQVIVAIGEILPTTKGEATITAPFSGTVSISGGISLGSRINNSQTAFTISTNVGEASDLVEKAGIELEAAKREYERDLKLADEQIVSKKELSECKERYEQAKVKYNNLSSKITHGQATAKSPINGFVKSIIVSDGAYVNAGDPLAVVTQNDKLMLQVKLPQRYHNNASSVKTVKFRTTYSDEIYSLDKMNGKQISQSVTTSDGGYFIPLLFEFSNQANIMSGTSVECYVVTNNKKNVITVPISAIAEDQGVAQVFVKKHEDAFKKQFVTLGETDGERTEILEGLRAGEIVATSFVQRLHLASSSNAIPAHTHSH
ncbi:MAG: efflux RND transporter periplasmic adaptor subunit [Paludibacteraceae bacterium]|nr:efflux RND transporter periplasmic adaptor subunit [Paludibacteraceae bacterium]